MIQKMEISALLPMKGHSERVPNKNMRIFGDKPLYHCIANILEKSEYVKEILINTDSDIIEKDALDNFSKVKIIKRPEDLCGDMVPMNAIIEYDINRCSYQHILQTHSTNPLLKLETLNNGIKAYFEELSDYDSLFSVTKIQTRLYDKNGNAVNHNPDILLRTQDLPPLFEENSNFYIFSKDSFIKANNKRIGLKPKMFCIDNKNESIDIDDMDDFYIAEILYKSAK